ncbi:hypothetical protein KUL42_22750 [Alteromonas sp. KUL42]|uniref:L-histidine N(alpha)-methyltransferase n=1 Tax=Alteromonas sp. KUL42 TaxID=2480797 RepID=UPI0010366A67|nr:L-histidine N(alpha)-methyltransferase [Alteromonas sp. KUL42]TAP34770.1 hypothetical protein EYR97_11215 [Alteromonas sp. KUL42]GEA07514.1 hypothetical protein KUL42_22750 [Alteromonas sp. KUL42]
MDIKLEIRNNLFKQIERAKSNVIKLSLPHYLYQTTEQAKAYELATYGSKQYHDSLDLPILNLIEENINLLCDSLPQNIQFIDLGPGYPSKSFRILDELQFKGLNITYFPVDVSEFFLKRATTAVTSRGIHCNQIHEKFENLAEVLDRKLFRDDGARYIFLGLTFNNFQPEYISKILSGLVNKGDRCVICCQSPEGISEEKLTSPYKTQSVDDFCFYPLKLLGLTRNSFEFTVVFESDAVRVRYQAKQAVRVQDLVVDKGTIIETSASYRYSLPDVEKALAPYFQIEGVFRSKVENLALLQLGCKEL